MKNKRISRGLKHISILIELELKSFFILLTIFTFVGFIGAISQIFLPELLALSGLQIIGLPDPSMFAIFVDFWGDLALMGAIVAIFYGVSAFSADLDVDKKIFFILNHPVSRTQHYLGKSLVKLLSVFLVVLISSIITYLFGLVFYPGFEILSLLLATGMLGMTIAAILSIVLMLNSRLSTSGTAISMGIYFLFTTIISFLVPFYDYLKWLSPFKLSDLWAQIILVDEYADVLLHFIGLSMTIIIALTIGNYLYNKRDL